MLKGTDFMTSCIFLSLPCVLKLAFVLLENKKSRKQVLEGERSLQLGLVGRQSQVFELIHSINLFIHLF